MTFVPDAQADSVREALFAAGCGNIGNYDSCSYNLKGEGTFRAKEGTHPFCGIIGELHHEEEVRIETILPSFKKAETIKALLAVSLFTVVPVRLYELSVSLQGTFTAALTGYGTSIGDVAGEVMQEFNAVESISDLTAGPLLGFGSITSGS